jgi:predicted outer membrane repeat protein
VCTTCPYQTIQAAIDAASPGAVVDIGAGDYVENLAASQDLTLRACPENPVRVVNTAYGNRTITVTGNASLTLIDIIVDGLSNHGDDSQDDDGGGIATDGDLLLARNSVVKNAGWNDGAGISAIGDGLTVTITDQTIIEDNRAVRYGAGALVDGLSDLVVSEGAIIRDNLTDSYGAGLAAVRGANVTMSGNVVCENNTGGGACLFVRRDTATRDISVVIEGDVIGRNNLSTVERDGGFARFSNQGTTTTYYPMDVRIRDRVSITGNTSGNDGGAISSRWAKVTVSGSVVLSGNTAADEGGAIWISTKTNSAWPAGVVGLTIADSVTLSGNTAAVGGGAVTASGTTMAISGSAVISGNTAPKGGGVYLDSRTPDSPVTYSSLDVASGSTITGNTASDGAGAGGGVYSDGAGNALTAAANTITANTPDNCAGAGISC